MTQTMYSRTYFFKKGIISAEEAKDIVNYFETDHYGLYVECAKHNHSIKDTVVVMFAGHSINVNVFVVKKNGAYYLTTVTEKGMKEVHHTRWLSDKFGKEEFKALESRIRKNSGYVRI